jgi:periplasmic protein TonB
MSDLQAQTAEWFSVDEVARAAGVTAEQAWRSIGLGQARLEDRHVPEADAVHLVRVLRGLEAPSKDRFLFNTVPMPSPQEMTRGVVLAGAVHVLAAILILAPALFGFQSDTDNEIKSPEPEAKLVFLMQLGKGGGGGGGGLREKTPAPPARRKAPVTLPKRVASPVPPARPTAAPPQPTPEPPKPEVRVVETPVATPMPPPPPPSPAVQAPVKSIPTDPLESPGLPEAPPRESSRGTGDRGGVGSGSGQGIGEGSGGGLGAGTGGGTGGGVYQPGAGIDPPTLIKEVRPIYTDEARRQRIQGDVVLEIVVRSDGSVGSIRVRHSLGGGLDQRAIEAVRQWRFNPARRHGTPVDVAVEVAVEFKLR